MRIPAWGLALALTGSAVALADQPSRPSPAPPAGGEQATPAAPAESEPVQVTTWVSRTAVWVGDRLDYVVELACAPDVDILAEDLGEDKLALDDLVLVAADRERVPRDGGGVTHRFRFRLTTYSVAALTLRIGPSTVRYYLRRAGGQPEDAGPMGEVRVPGAVIARRSTLPDQIPSLALRDRGALEEAPLAVRVAGPVGIGLLLAAAGPVAIWAVTVVRASRRRVRRPSVRVARSHARVALEEIRALDVTEAPARLDAYGRLDAALRHHLLEARGLPAHALCARELSGRLDAASPAASSGAIVDLLSECERVRYDSPVRLPSAERFAAALTEAERIVEDGRR